MSNCWLLSALQMVLSTPAPGRVGIHGRLPVKSPLSWIWLAPSYVAYSWLVGRTHLGPTVSESYSCFKSASSIIILWHMATSFIFPTRESGFKVWLQRTLVLSPQESLTMKHSCPQAHEDPGGHLNGVRQERTLVLLGRAQEDSPWSFPYEMPWLQRDYPLDWGSHYSWNKPSKFANPESCCPSNQSVLFYKALSS